MGLTRKEAQKLSKYPSENRSYYTSMTGEFYVLAQLFSRGYMASLTYGNAKSVDILVSASSGKMFRIEVKTSSYGYPIGSEKSHFGKNYQWRMSEKHEEKIDPDLYYCFVALKGKDEMPEFFIVPSREVAKYVKRQHQYWKNIKRNREVKDSEQRTLRIGFDSKSHGLRPKEKYSWDILPK